MGDEYDDTDDIRVLVAMMLFLGAAGGFAIGWLLRGA